MNPTLRNVADILPALLRNAIPKPSGPGFLLELEGAEMDALREMDSALRHGPWMEIIKMITEAHATGRMSEWERMWDRVSVILDEEE